MSAALGVVVIGRNEGERLVAALRSLAGQTVVYVDSGSTDSSVQRARDHGAEVVSIDPPYTAARARNVGMDRLLGRNPNLAYVQFVDGDCEVEPTWLSEASRHLERHPEVGAVCGRRREQYPRANVYHRLIEMEWDAPTGEVNAFGGDVLVRVAAFQKAGGYDGSLIAGEDPELALRMRRAGYRIVRLPRPMTVHDARVDRFGQWWRRQLRCGHAYAESASIHGRGPEHFRVRETCSSLFWGALLPFLALAGLGLGGPPGALVLAAYPAQLLRIVLQERDRYPRRDDRILYAGACILAKFAEARGIAAFAWNRWIRARPSALIEYKGPRGRFPSE